MKNKLSTLAAVVAAALILSGCTQESADSHDHEGHSHDGHAHEHGQVLEEAAAGVTKAAQEAVKAYPLETCIVSGEKLGSMGEPVTLVHAGQEIKLCCDNCVDDFKAEPEKFLAKLAPAQ